MAGHGYKGGRLNLPFVGHSTFAKAPPVTDWDAIDADIAVMGAPFDCGTQYRAGARFGARGSREASTRVSFGHAGAFGDRLPTELEVGGDGGQAEVVGQQVDVVVADLD